MDQEIFFENIPERSSLIWYIWGKPSERKICFKIFLLIRGAYCMKLFLEQKFHCKTTSRLTRLLACICITSKYEQPHNYMLWVKRRHFPIIHRNPLSLWMITLLQYINKNHNLHKDMVTKVKKRIVLNIM